MFGKDTYKSHASFRTAAILLGAAWLLVACVKIDDPGVGPDDEWQDLLGDKPIAFGSSVAETKASSPLADGKDFGVFAFFQEGDIENHITAHWQVNDTDPISWIPNFMYNTQVNKDGGKYTYSPIKYWPNNAENTISFWAYSPHDANATFLAADTNVPYTNATAGLPDIQFDVTTGHDDFMTSSLVKDQFHGDPNTPDNTVCFDFEHKLSWVEFKAQAAADYSAIGLSLTVTSIQVFNDYSRAVYRQGVSDWRDPSIERKEANAVTAFTGNVTLENNNPKPCTTAPLLMIPQEITHVGTGNKVTVIVKYNQRINGFDISKTAVVELDNVPGIDAWEKNKRYVYTFSISAGDAINLSVEVQPWEYWLGTSDYTENVTITKPIEWEKGTFETGSAGANANYTEEASFTIDDGSGYTGTYKVLVLKPGTNLKGSFIFDTPYQGKWYAMLEPIMGSRDGSIVFSDDSIMKEGLVGNESTIEIKAAGTAITAQYAILRFMCRTVPVDPDDPSTAQSLYVNPVMMGGQFVIKQNIN